MFDFTVCMLSNPAPPPSTVSKYASVTLPLKPVLCDKGCRLKGDWNAKFPWAPVPPVSRVLIRSPPQRPAEAWRGTLGTRWHQGRLGLLRSILLSLSPVETSSLREENVWITDWVFSRWWLYSEGSFFISCATMKKRFGFCCFISANLQG